jgi:hypothetical protein
VVSVYPAWLLVVVPLTYAHVYWRGLRPPLWKWVGSAAFVTLAAVAASEALALGNDDLSLDGDLASLLPILASMVVSVTATTKASTGSGRPTSNSTRTGVLKFEPVMRMV